MLILEAGNIRKYYRDRLITSVDELKIYSGDRIGVIGQNGSGKTTLMNILSKEIEPDEGFVRHYCETAYIRQFTEADEKLEADPKLLKEFNLHDKLNQKVYSGGEKTRIKIANALCSERLLVFADEPTANLDYKGIELLRQKLEAVESLMLISHDRELLDSVCNRIIEVRDGKIRLFKGNYSSYREQSENEHKYAELEYEKYISEKNSLEAAISNRKSKSKSIRKTPKRMGNSEARLHKRSSTEIQEKINSAVKSLETRLEKLEVKEKPKELSQIRLDFSLTNPPENKIVISGEKLNFSYGSRKIFDDAEFKVYNGMKTAVRGENGTGKTTLMNLINSNSCESIHIVPKARIGYFYQGFENLDYDRTVLENVMKDSIQSQAVARTILARLLISGDDVFKKAGVLSGGERIKVSFAKLFVSNSNVLLLDEPTNFLDMMSIEALENVLCDYEGTVLFVSHDNAFTEAVADRLLILEKYKITNFDGTYEEYMNSLRKPQAEVKSETDRIILQMKIAETVARLSRPNADREALEEEYKRLILQLK